MTTAIIITLSVLLLASFFLLGRVGMLSSSRYNKIRSLNAKIERYRQADIDTNPLYAVRKMIADVMIMCMQMAHIFGQKEVEKWGDKKIHRLAERLKGGAQ